MKIRNIAISFIILILFGCAQEEYQQIPRSELIHDNSSKVWILEEYIVDSKNKESISRANRECAIFYKDQELYVYKLRDFGLGNYSKAHYSFVGRDSIQFKWTKKYVETYAIESMNSEELVLVDSLSKKMKKYVAFDKP